MWGKMKNTGDDWMYPKPVMDLRFLTLVTKMQNTLLLLFL